MKGDVKYFLMKRRHFIHFHIAGFTYYEGPLVFNQLEIGTELKLVLEPENRYDPKAIALYMGENKLGFVPKNENSAISKILEQGHKIFEARVQQLDKTANPEQQVGVIVYLLERGYALKKTT